MVFEKIDKNSWNRKEYFDHYFASVPCTYSMTVKVDITQIKEKGMKLYPAMLYYIAMIVNRHSEFRTAINQDGPLCGMTRALGKTPDYWWRQGACPAFAAEFSPGLASAFVSAQPVLRQFFIQRGA